MKIPTDIIKLIFKYKNSMENYENFVKFRTHIIFTLKVLRELKKFQNMYKRIVTRYRYLRLISFIEFFLYCYKLNNRINNILYIV